MERVTAECIRRRVELINVRYMGNSKFELSVEFLGSPARPRISLSDGGNITRDLSMRATRREILAWLEGFMEAFNVIDDMKKEKGS